MQQSLATRILKRIIQGLASTVESTVPGKKDHNILRSILYVRLLHLLQIWNDLIRQIIRLLLDHWCIALNHTTCPQQIIRFCNCLLHFDRQRLLVSHTNTSQKDIHMRLRQNLCITDFFQSVAHLFKRKPHRLFSLSDNQDRNLCVLCRLDLILISTVCTALLRHKTTNLKLRNQCFIHLYRKRSLHRNNLLSVNSLLMTESQTFHPRKHTHKKAILNRRLPTVYRKFLASCRKKNVPFDFL